MSGSNAYSFRVRAEGIGDVAAELDRLKEGGEGAQRALEGIAQAGPRSAEALSKVAEQTERATKAAAEHRAATQQQVEIYRANSEGLDTLATRATTAAAALRTVAGSGIAQGFGPLPSVLTTVATGLDTAASSGARLGTALEVAGRFILPLGAAIATVVIATTDWQAVTTRVGDSLRDLRGSMVDGNAATTAYNTGILGLIQSLETAADRERRLAQETRQRILASAQAALPVIQTQFDVAQRRVNELQPIADQVAEARRIAGPDTAIGGAAGRRFADYEAAVRVLEDLRTRLRTAEGAIQDQLNIPYGQAPLPTVSAPPAPPRVTATTARAAALSPVTAYEYTDIAGQTVFPAEAVQAAWDRNFEVQQRAQQRAADEALRAEQRLQDARERANERATDSIVRYSADGLAGLLDKQGKGWAGLWDTIEKGGRQAFARIAAEAIIRPIIAPIVSGLGLGSFTGSGAAATANGSGGGFGGLSSLSGLSNLLPSGGISGITDSIGLTSGGSLFGIGTTPGSFASNPISLGGALGGIGAGFAAGSLLGGFVAGDSPSRQTNSQIGAGLGSLAGVAGAALAPGTFGTSLLLAGLLGGAGGGALGGLLGPGAKTNAFGFTLAAEGGRFSTDGLSTTGNGNGGAEVLAQARQAVDQVNAAIAAAQLSVLDNRRAITGVNSGDQSANFGDAARFFRFGSSNDQIATALRAAPTSNLDEALGISSFVTGIYTELSKASEPADAFKQQLEAINKTFEDAKDRARGYELSLDGLNARQAEAVTLLQAQREQTITAGLANRSRVLGDFLASRERSSGSAQSQFLSAQSQFGDALSAARAAGAESADLTRLVGSANALLTANAGFNGSGSQGALVESLVRRQVIELGGALDLPGFTDDLTGAIDRAANRQVDQLQLLRDSVEGLREEFRSIRLRSGLA